MHSSTRNHNNAVFASGVKQFKDLERRVMRTALTSIGMQYVEHACDNHGVYGGGRWQGFTGNTQTSYGYGLYEDGKLIEIYIAGWNARKIIRNKIKLNQTVRLKEPYEGNERVVQGEVEVNNMTGAETSEMFIRSYKPKTNKGWEIMVTTGTEYSELVELKYGNVLTLTFQEAASILDNNMKPIMSLWQV